jgi:hypothetical protein
MYTYQQFSDHSLRFTAITRMIATCDTFSRIATTGMGVIITLLNVTIPQ